MLDQERERSVLVVDDNSRVRHLVTRWLETDGFMVQAAADADEAVRTVQMGPVAVALCDIRMPGRDGLWLASHLRSQYPETAIIMATAVCDVSPALTSLRRGVLDYLMKPFGRDRLRGAVGRGIDWHRAAVDGRRWRETLESECRVRFTRLADAVSALRVESPDALDALLSMLTRHDRDAYAHGYRVVGLAVSVARLLGLDEAATATVERAALLHDVGKFAMPDAVLLKPAPLTVEEMDLVRTHPQLGYELTRELPYLAGAAELIWASAERVDGLGYPRGLGGAAIPVGSRIIAVADAYDTMTRSRVFRGALSRNEALLELSRCAGAQFDAHVVDGLPPRRQRALRRRAPRRRRSPSRHASGPRGVLDFLDCAPLRSGVHSLQTGRAGRSPRRPNGAGAAGPRRPQGRGVDQSRTGTLESRCAGALRGGRAARRGGHRGERAAGVPDRPAHGALAERQVPRARAVER